MKEFYSPKEAAEMLSVNRKTILTLINSGRLKATNIAVGTRALYRISRSELENFINQNKEYGTGDTKNQETN
ncbi:MAG: helix-turn-helix domain-containing protein [Candidatus Omnitrophota bacterium]|jgi:excisionase family DNA binding protein